MKNINKKYKLLYWLFLFIPLLLIACSPEKALSKEEVAKEVSANQEKVQNYQVDINLNTTVKDLKTGDVVNESKTFSEITIDEKTMDSFGKLRSEANQRKMAQEYYSIDDRAYLKLDSGNWEDVSAQQAEYFHNTDTLYAELVPILDVLVKEGELQEKNNEYIFTYTGQNTDIYKAFEKPYNLQFGNVNPENIHQDVQVAVEKDTLFITSVENTLTAEDAGYDLNIYIKQIYGDINDIGEFIIPQEVIDEAEA